MGKSKRTKATSIPPKIREEVEERDGHRCVFCNSPNCRGEAHYIARSHGGLGIPMNLITVCRECHREMDNGSNTKLFKDIAKTYLQSIYPDWNEKDLIYKKWEGFKYD